MNENNDERWKEIKGFEGLYWISNKGRIKSRYGIRKTHKNKRGYVVIGLNKDGKQYAFLVHRLVAMAFVPNPNPKNNCINHLDEIKDNNVPSNLSWVSIAENNRYGTGYTRRMQTLSKKKHKKRMPVYRLEVNDDGTCQLTYYESMYMASKLLGIERSSIRRCCNGIQKKAGGYYWFLK